MLEAHKDNYYECLIRSGKMPGNNRKYVRQTKNGLGGFSIEELKQTGAILKAPVVQTNWHPGLNNQKTFCYGVQQKIELRYFTMCCKI